VLLILISSQEHKFHKEGFMNSEASKAVGQEIHRKNYGVNVLSPEYEISV
jgi:hypothetical protein